MKKIHTEFWVEHEFSETSHGYRPNCIRSFKTKAEAESFAATTADGKVVEIEFTEYIEA